MRKLIKHEEIPVIITLNWQKLLYKSWGERLLNSIYPLGKEGVDVEKEIIGYEFNRDPFRLMIMNSLGEYISLDSQESLEVHSLVGSATVKYPILANGSEKFEWNVDINIFHNVIKAFFPNDDN